MDSPTGSGPTGSFDFNPTYFPTQATAETIAQMLGGKVVAQNVNNTAVAIGQAPQFVPPAGMRLSPAPTTLPSTSWSSIEQMTTTPSDDAAVDERPDAEPSKDAGAPVPAGLDSARHTI